MLCPTVPQATCREMAVLAASLANGGTNPLTQRRVFHPPSVQDALSLMMTCGMYDFSGEWAFKMGIPAKSGVGGCVFAVVPNVMGIAAWSPPLDTIGNRYEPARALQRPSPHPGACVQRARRRVLRAAHSALQRALHWRAPRHGRCACMPQTRVAATPCSRHHPSQVSDKADLVHDRVHDREENILLLIDAASCGDLQTVKVRGASHATCRTDSWM